MNIQIPNWARSSVDPTEVSLTVTSFTKAFAGLITTLAILKGVDPAIVTPTVNTVTDAAQNIVAQYLAILPALYSTYHSVQVLYGLARKVGVWFFTKKAVV